MDYVEFLQIADESTNRLVQRVLGLNACIGISSTEWPHGLISVYEGQFMLINLQVPQKKSRLLPEHGSVTFCHYSSQHPPISMVSSPAGVVWEMGSQRRFLFSFFAPNLPTSTSLSLFPACTLVAGSLGFLIRGTTNPYRINIDPSNKF